MINPLGNRVLLKMIKTEEVQRDSGLVLPGPANVQDVHQAEVMAIGPDVEHLEVGDLVLSSRHVGHFVEYNQDEFLLVEEPLVLAQLDRE